MPPVSSSSWKDPSSEDDSTSSSSLSWSWIFTMIAPIYVSIRLYVSNRIPISDCDEVYNYWEPLHHILYEEPAVVIAAATAQHVDDTVVVAAHAQQTWEYAHEYALRTYAYLLPLKYAGRFLTECMFQAQAFHDFRTFLIRFLVGTSNTNLVVDDKLLLFYCLRGIVGMTSAIAEIYFSYAVWTRMSSHGKDRINPSHHGTIVVICTGMLFLTTTGMNIAASALLPSSTYMITYLFASTAFLLEYHILFVGIAVTITLISGWPFGVVILIPIGISVLMKEYNHNSIKGIVRLLTFTVFVTCLVQGTVMYIDKYYYGTWVSATFNIFMYNAHGSGDELYGIEPVSYYIKNLLLNLNLVAILGIPAFFVVYYSKQQQDMHDITLQRDFMTLLIPLFLWMAITFTRPHKEERFLFPIYPILCFGSVLVVDSTINVFGRCFLALFSRHKHIRLRGRIIIHACIWIPIITLSIMRTMALSKYYTAPLHIYAHLSHLVLHQQKGQSQEQNQVKVLSLVCTCGEWYRFPSTFFLPSSLSSRDDNAADTNNHAFGVQLGYLPSSFTGQLPQPFTIFGSRQAIASQDDEAQARRLPGPFNDMNLHEPSRYVQSWEDCDWIVDLDSNGDEACSLQARLTTDVAEQKKMRRQVIVAQYPFLNAGETVTLHRTLYIPYLHERGVQQGKVKYSSYVLYQIVDDDSDMDVNPAEDNSS